MNKAIVLVLVLLSFLKVSAVPVISTDKSGKLTHPRIYCSDESKPQLKASIANVDWKKEMVERKKENLEKYLQYCEQDSTWLVSRLQMNWKTKHNEVYLNGGEFSHSDGNAPVPTVRFSGTRDWATDYKTPSIVDVEPYFDDVRGMFFENKKTNKKEWVQPSEVGHGIEKINRSIMSMVEDAAFLYWYTGEEKYAKFAAPVFFTYIDGMYYRNPPIDLKNSNQAGVSGLATFEVIHEKVVMHLAVAYDFLYNYFEDNKYSSEHTSAVFQKWGDQIIKNGIPDNNWNLFQARFLTYIALVLEDDTHYENGKGQQYYLKNTFEISSKRQIALKESILVYDQDNGMWPESPSYSMHVTTTLLEILALLDNVSNANELANYPIIEKAALAAFQYLFPSGYSVGFGDSGHGIITPENYELLIANYQKYDLKEKELAITALLQQLIDKGLYKRTGKDFFKLFFYVDQLNTVSEKNKENSENLTSPTFYAPNVSWFVQRLGKSNDAMMVSTVGSFGNHCHANGIAIELFANNYVLGPDMGRGSSYWHSDFREYYSKPVAHNTVVVDSKSSYSNMRGYHPFVLDNHFPSVGDVKPTFDKLSYSKVSFLEPSTNSDQQRLTALIKTPKGSGYVLDIFHSKKKEQGKQRHEYIYHNLGQSLSISTTNEKLLKMNETKELHSKNGDAKGYNYFTDKKSVKTSKDINALFRIQSKSQPEQFMKMWIKGSEDQEIFSVLGPKSNALAKGTAPKELLDEKVPAIILRKEHEAWTNPFVTVFNPYVKGQTNPISTVEFSGEKLGLSTEEILVEHVDKNITDRIIANTSERYIATSEAFYQKGLLSVYRSSKEKESPDYIFLSGMIQFKYKDWEITTINTPVTVSIERVGNELIVSNDKPLVLKIPILPGFKPTTLQVFKDGKLVASREGIIGRDNPNRVEYRLDKAYKNASIVLNE